MTNPRFKKTVIPVGILSLILGTITLEGGYVNDPRDSGGETNYGVTKKVAVANGYTGPMRAMPKEVAQSIYYDKYFLAPHFDKIYVLDQVVPKELFDTAVNMGPTIPVRFMQTVLNKQVDNTLKVDGVIKDADVKAYMEFQTRFGLVQSCKLMLGSLDKMQLDRYKAIVARNPKNKVFYRGWVNHRIGNVNPKECSYGVTTNVAIKP